MLNFQINKSYTLIEFLIILGIISLLSTIIIYQLKPIEYFQNIRDSKRINDLKSLETILNILTLEDKNLEAGLSTTTIYVSLFDNSPTCSSWIFQLPSLPSGWQYKCSATPTLINGQGWIPIDFTTSSRSKIIKLTSLPIDPINKPPYYYSYVAGGSYKITAKPERNYKNAIEDGGIEPLLYEVGTNKKLSTFQSGLVGYWSFDEGNGTTAYDLSGFGNNGTLIDASSTNSDGNTPPQWVDGKVGKSLSFDGMDDYVITNNNIDLYQKEFTILGWFQTANETTSEKILFGHGDSYTTCRRLHFVIRNNRPRFGLYNCDFASNTYISKNIWHFIAFVNRNTGSDQIYLNGNLDTSGNVNVYQSTPTPFYIGKWSGANYFFPGLIDEVRIYNRALSDEEIKALYEATK